MAPRAASRSKNHKSKGEKKRKEDRLLPSVLDILVNLPSGEEVILKGISTDRILDVRKLLAVNVETCHLTRFSLSHQVRGDQLSDSQEVIHLKPCVLTLVEEAYSHVQAMENVRRVLDIVACTTSFGPSSKFVEEIQEQNINPQSEFAGIASLCPPSKLGKFYEFFSFAHLKSPIQAIRKLSRQSSADIKDFFSLEIKMANGKPLTITACSEGFYHAGKQHVKTHSLVDLLRHLSKAFDDAYEDLLKGFSDRNKFANIPYNLRANTWLVPPVAAESPSVFPSLPAEDENWGGNGGGQGRLPESLKKPWAQQFEFIAKMPCATSEEREVRDHKAFVLHNYFVDVATTHAVFLIRELSATSTNLACEQHVETRGTLKFTITRDLSDPCEKTVWKIDSSSSSLQNESQEGISKRNLLKGITADESTVVHDVNTLGVVLVRHQGYKAVVEAVISETHTEKFDIVDPPDGGANALNANSLRTLLHKKSIKLEAVADDNKRAEELVSKVVEDGIAKLTEQQAESDENPFIRWELGACWIQHLGESSPKEEKSDKSSNKELLPKEEDAEADSPLKDILSESCLERLRGTKSGLHLKHVPELLHDAQEYYTTVALPKLVSDFAALELSPVEGRTLTDFMHIRGLRISSLGQLADMCGKLPHIRSLCIHEMIIRAFKHLLRAVVASVTDTYDLASTVATALNAIFGQLPTDEQTSAENHVWKWLELFVYRRFGWKFSSDSRLSLRKYAILRGLCYKVGIEMVPRDYDFGISAPFTKADVISMVPVYKHAICSSADGRTLLESSKAALDKGKLEDAVTYGSKALAKLIAVCGPYHRMTAGAYSLLAVVLYHTGDFIQAMTYQQKALDINERELGLDHPDTMKSYGDLAVFYYRLQHTELALRYVNRALYLLHLICGPSHPNTAATYINVAMMEEALGNPHVALRYLHEALKCNERLLGKDHIQTAASYHAIAIALSLMEAYTLSVHHEQTTFQILQAKLGPDDIRTQDAAAWLEYFDSKAVEQQEAARTGAPKPDPNVASKGHLSVSDLLDYINTEVAASKEKENKKSKRLKILSQKQENRNFVDGFMREVAGVSETVTEKVEPQEDVKAAVNPNPEKKPEQLLESPKQRPVVEQLRSYQEEKADQEEGCWFEATSRGKYHRKNSLKVNHSQQTTFSQQTGLRKVQANEYLADKTNLKHEEDSKVLTDQAPASLELPPPPAAAAVAAAAAAYDHQQARSYRDVALMSPQMIMKCPQRSSSQTSSVAAAKAVSQSGIQQKSDVEEDSSSSSSAAAQPLSASDSPSTARGVAASPLRPIIAVTKAADHQQQSPVAVAVTPIRKQVLQIPSSATHDQACCIPSSPAVTAPADSISAAAAAAKKPMNPLAMEFVPGREWHPFVRSSSSSETNTLQTGGRSPAAAAAAAAAGTEIQTEKEEASVKIISSKNQPPLSAEDGHQTTEEATVTVQQTTDDEETSVLANGGGDSLKKLMKISASGYYSSDSSCGNSPFSSSNEDFSSIGGGTTVMMKKQRSSSSSSRSSMKRSSASAQGRWQRRSDGAITRVYRLQGDKSSANPQLRTTSTFTDVSEPHTLQPVSVMRRSVRVS